jgi:hypothetical protein
VTWWFPLARLFVYLSVGYVLAGEDLAPKLLGSAAALGSLIIDLRGDR